MFWRHPIPPASPRQRTGFTGDCVRQLVRRPRVPCGRRAVTFSCLCRPIVRSDGARRNLGAIMAVTNARYTAKHDQPAIEVAIEVEGDIRELVRRNVATKPERQPETESELVASNINSVLERVTVTSVQEIDQLIAELEASRDMLQRGGA